MLEPNYGLNRRGFLHLGAAGVVGKTIPWPIALSQSTQEANQTGKCKAKSVLLVLLSGGGRSS